MKFLIAAFLFLGLFSCKKTSEITPGNTSFQTLPNNNILTGNNFSVIKLKFKSYAGQELLNKSSEYTNSAGEKFKVNRFQYYISNLKLTDTKGVVIEFPKTYFLINGFAKDSVILNNVPNNTYSKISFLLGIDSTTSKSGAQSGDLDPSNNMFMEWSGYTYLAFGGQYQQSSQLKDFNYIIRGFTPASYYAVQNIELNLNAPLEVNTNRRMVFKADVLEIFTTPVSFSIAEEPVIDHAGPEAVMFSKNYKDMFSVISVE